MHRSHSHRGDQASEGSWQQNNPGGNYHGAPVYTSAESWQQDNTGGNYPGDARNPSGHHWATRARHGVERLGRYVGQETVNFGRFVGSEIPKVERGVENVGRYISKGTHNVEREVGQGVRNLERDVQHFFTYKGNNLKADSRPFESYDDDTQPLTRYQGGSRGDKIVRRESTRPVEEDVESSSSVSSSSSSSSDEDDDGGGVRSRAPTRDGNSTMSTFLQYAGDKFKTFAQIANYLRQHNYQLSTYSLQNGATVKTLHLKKAMFLTISNQGSTPSVIKHVYMNSLLYGIADNHLYLPKVCARNTRQIVGEWTLKSGHLFLWVPAEQNSDDPICDLLIPAACGCIITVDLTASLPQESFRYIDENGDHLSLVEPTVSTSYVSGQRWHRRK